MDDAELCAPPAPLQSLVVLIFLCCKCCLFNFTFLVKTIMLIIYFYTSFYYFFFCEGLVVLLRVPADGDEVRGAIAELLLGWHYLSNATCLIRPRLLSTALLV